MLRCNGGRMAIDEIYFYNRKKIHITGNASVILSCFGCYVVPTLLTPSFRRSWCWCRLGATLCHDVLRCCHAIATPEPRYCPVLTRLTSDTGKFIYVVLRFVSLAPRCSLAAPTLPYAVPRCASLLSRNSLVSCLGYINLVTYDARLILAHNHNRYPRNMPRRKKILHKGSRSETWWWADRSRWPEKWSARHDGEGCLDSSRWWLEGQYGEMDMFIYFSWHVTSMIMCATDHTTFHISTTTHLLRSTSYFTVAQRNITWLITLHHVTQRGTTLCDVQCEGKFHETTT